MESIYGDHRRREDDAPSYLVEHLATFGVGPQFGLQWPNDGIRKLKQMERSSAIWAQRMLLRLRREAIVVEDENGEVVEQFPLHLVAEPTAHLSNDSRDVYNNLLVFIVSEDRQKRTATPTEMHIFQCKLVAANEVAEDIRLYLSGRFSQVPPGLRDTGFETPYHSGAREPEPSSYALNSRSVDHSPIHRPPERHVTRSSNFAASRDDQYASSDYFERDVNTLNRCFDDIERFVARIQTCALAQRDIEMHMHRRAGKRSSKPQSEEAVLRARAQLPIEPEFVAVFQKFKLCFNLLAKLKSHIHEPNAPELLHFLFTPLTVILDACQWGIGRPVAQNVIMPLINKEAKELMLNCLTSKESEVWMSLGDAWRIPIEEWPHPLPTSYSPTFDTMGPHSHRSTAPIDPGRIDLEKQRLELERERLAMKEEVLREKERLIQEEKRSLHELKRRFDEEKRSIASDHPPHLEEDIPVRLPTSRSTGDIYRDVHRGVERNVPVVLASSTTAEAARHRCFLEDLRARRCKVAQVTYDRVGQNPKELSVTKGEFLEVLNDTKKWWECRNVNNRIGYVPNTIVTVIDNGSPDPYHNHNGGRAVDQQIFVRPDAGAAVGGSNSGPPSSSLYMQQERGASQARGFSASPHDGPLPETPDYLRNRIGPSSLIYQPAYSSSSIPPPSPPSTRTALQTEDSQPVRNYQPCSAAPPPPPPPIHALLNSTNGGYSTTRTTSSGGNSGPTIIKVGNGDASAQHSAKESDMQIHAIVRERSAADLLRDEITSTLGKKKTSEILAQKKAGSVCGAPTGITIHSNELDVAEWLEGKGFSVRTQKLLEGQTGATLFCLSKKQMQDFCGKDEGHRLYSQLLVQKNTSGYKSSGDAELRAILANRKGKSEARANDDQKLAMNGMFSLSVHD